MTIDERVQKSTTRIFKTVFPNTTNHYDTMFGGTVMALMDEVAFMTGAIEGPVELPTIDAVD